MSGPTPLPLLGNLHQLIKQQPGYQFMANNKKTYGSIYTWWMGNFFCRFKDILHIENARIAYSLNLFHGKKQISGSTPVVTISDYELMKETFVKDGDSYSSKHDFKGTNQEFRGILQFAIM